MQEVHPASVGQAGSLAHVGHEAGNAQGVLDKETHEVLHKEVEVLKKPAEVLRKLVQELPRNLVRDELLGPAQSGEEFQRLPSQILEPQGWIE